MKTTQTPAAEN